MYRFMIALRSDAPVEAVVPDRPVWLHHGSSISHGSDAASPSHSRPTVVPTGMLRPVAWLFRPLEKDTCSMRRAGNGGGFLIGHSIRFCYHRSLFGQTFILGVGAKILLKRRCKNLVAYLEALDIFARCFNFTGEFHAEDRIFWFSET